MATPALAERRVALVVGANAGWSGDRPLKHAEDDARRVRDVLVQLGGFAEADVALLAEPNTTALRAALARVAQPFGAAGEPTLFFFYYSGHADANALHLRGPTLPVAELVAALSASKAGLTVAVVDACMSGAILAAKGATPVLPFRLRAEEPVQGLALLSSSDADELSQESRALAGSVFTHHWVSGLRGAADDDGDGAVTLMEAYGYAYERTRADTLATSLPQRPGFRFELKGQGDVTLTRVTTAGAALRVEAGPAQRYVVLDASERALVGEVLAKPARATQVAVPPGDYVVKRPVEGGLEVALLRLGAGQTASAQGLAYQRAPAGAALVKGGAVSSYATAEEALAAFDRTLAEDPFETVARRGKARVRLLQAQTHQRAGATTEERQAIDEALALDPGLADDPSFARFAERARVLRDAEVREKTVREATEAELRRNPRLRRKWGLGFQLFSTKGIIVLEGHFTPFHWLSLTLGVDLVGPGVDVSARWLPLGTPWTPYLGLGGHFGTRAWRGQGSGGGVSVNGMSTGLSYDDIWGSMVHADVGMQWMSEGGFAVEFGGGPMLFYAPPAGGWAWFGFLNLGIGWYF